MKYKDPVTGNWKEVYIKVSDTLPVGAICQYGGSTAPSGYLMCNGQAVSRTTYADLFKAIGTSFGAGDGVTTFNVPNFNGRVPVGLDGTDTDFDTLGETGGSKYLQEHSHTLYGYHYISSGGAEGGHTSGGNITDAQFSTNPAGTGDSGNLQPYLVTNFIIKASNRVALDRGNVVDVASESTEDAYSCSYMNSKLENNIIVGQKVVGEHTIISDGNYYKIPLANSHSIGNKLTLVDGDIKIGTGVNKIKVEATCQYKGGTASYFILEIARVRNNTSSRLNLAVGTAGVENTLGTSIEIAEVQENDLIRINYASIATDARIVGDSTKLYVEVVE